MRMRTLLLLLVLLNPAGTTIYAQAPVPGRIVRSDIPFTATWFANYATGENVEIRADPKRHTIVVQIDSACAEYMVTCVQQLRTAESLAKKRPKEYRVLLFVTSVTDARIYATFTETTPIVVPTARRLRADTFAWQRDAARLSQRNGGIPPLAMIVAPTGRVVAVSNGAISEHDVLETLRQKPPLTQSQTVAREVPLDEFSLKWAAGAKFAHLDELPQVLTGAPADIVSQMRALAARSGSINREFSAEVVAPTARRERWLLTAPELGSELQTGARKRTEAIFADFHTHPGRTFASPVDVAGAASHNTIKMVALPQDDIFLLVPTRTTRNAYDVTRIHDWAGVYEWLYNCVAKDPRDIRVEGLSRLYAKTLGVGVYELQGDRFVRLPEPPGELSIEEAPMFLAHVKLRIAAAMETGREVNGTVLGTPSRLEDDSRAKLPSRSYLFSHPSFHIKDNMVHIITSRTQTVLATYDHDDTICTQSPKVYVHVVPTDSRRSLYQTWVLLAEKPTKRYIVQGTTVTDVTAN